ncbi:MAG: DMT family transporter [Actinobacteria bacterium]|nr:MAG: DMT family transporter [Actinomycetota bacterium]
MASFVGSGIAKSLMGRVERVRRPEIADLMLFATVVIWSLNFTVTKYVLNHGFKPLAYSAVRFGTAALLFIGFTWVREHSFRLARRDIPFMLGAATVGIFLNSVAFIYGTKLTTAATVALIFGTMPILTALFAAVGGIERLHSRFWLAAAVSFGGVCMVAFGAKSGISGDLWGYALALFATATWAAYSVAIAPLMTRYTASRISAWALTVGAIPLLAVGSPQLASQDYGDLPSLVWLAFVFAVLAPLFLTNLLWFNSIDRVGPSRASLYTNLQPFLGAVFALVLLHEPLTRYQVAGGLLIAVGIVLSRRREPVLVPSGESP